MPTPTKEKTINIPVNGLTLVGRNEENGKAVCEVDLNDLRQINEADVVDMLIRDAQSDYKAGNYKTADNTADLISDLRGEYEN